MRLIPVTIIAAMTMTACASQVPSPVSGQYREAFAIDAVRVDLPDTEKIPDRYDETINRILAEESALTPTQIARFTSFADNRGGLTDTNSGELLLEYLVQEQLERQLPGYFTGDRPAELDISIASTTFPNTATMMLVGEVIGASYDISLTDTATGVVLAETTEPISPYIQPSAGAGGGLLGLALRGAGERHLIDLQNMAFAIASEVTMIVGGTAIHPSDLDRIAIYPIPDLPEEEMIDGNTAGVAPASEIISE